MFRMIRRAPWIALGAAGAFYFDSVNGAARRRDVVRRARELAQRARGELPPSTNGPSFADIGAAFDEPTGFVVTEEVLVEVVSAGGGEWTADGYGGESGGA